MKFKFLPLSKISKTPIKTGVYAFFDEKQILYIGKAANLRKRVKNHFQQPAYRDNLFLDQVKKVGWIEMDSEIEALILEAELIKKYQPKFNILWRDDKNYFYVAATKDNYPYVFITHQPKTNLITLGPFVDGKALKKVLKVLRRVFPYSSFRKHPKNPCPWCHLDLCPGPLPDLKEYKKNIRNLFAVLKGKKTSVLKNLREEMKRSASLKNFERAGEIRDRIFALEKVLVNAKVIETPLMRRFDWKETEKKLKNFLREIKKISRIEAYDVSNIQGKEATGSMITFIKGIPNKNFYRHFKIKISGKPNDVAMIKEILTRRFTHPEWSFPDLILIDGGIAQLNAALKLKTQNSKLKTIKVMALAKRKNELYIEGKKKPIRLNSLPDSLKFAILQLRDEAHRFAISYHRKLRKKALLI